MPKSVDDIADNTPAEPPQPTYTLAELVEMYSRTVMLGVGALP